MVKSFKEISKVIKEVFSLHESRAKAMTMIVFAMINCETVNLSKLSKHLKTSVKQESSYKRLQRFISTLSYFKIYCNAIIKIANNIKSNI